MKILQAINGEIQLNECDDLSVEENHVLVKTSYSAISPGTELMMTRESQEDPVNIGYSASGVIVELGKNVDKFEVGDRVAVYGAPYVGHKSLMSVPKTLVSKVPEHVPLELASMGGLGAIAIHGLRQAQLNFGEVCVVVGLGIYGQLIAQIAANAGLVVLALNRSEPRATLLHEVSGIKTFTDEVKLVEELMLITDNRGADAVFLCAGGKASPLTNKSLEWLRDRGTSVIVGDIEPLYDRELMFSKELTIKISRAGGPGRYDQSYEKYGVDYPYGYVRWTEGRNVGEFIRLLSEDRITVDKYVSEPTPIEEYKDAYEELAQSKIQSLSHIFKY